MTGRLLVARVLLYNLKGPRRSGLGASHAIQPNSLDMYVGHLFRKKIMSFDVSVTKIHMYLHLSIQDSLRKNKVEC